PRSQSICDRGPPVPRKARPLLLLERLEERCRAAADGRADERALLAAGDRADAGTGASRPADDERGFLPVPLRLDARGPRPCADAVHGPRNSSNTPSVSIVAAPIRYLGCTVTGVIRVSF